MHNLLFSMAEFSDSIVETLNGTLGIWYLIILNAFGVIAILLKVIEYQLKNRNIILIFAILAATCWLIYFAMQGDMTATAMGVIGVIQLLIFLQRGKHAWADSVWWLVGFLIIQVSTAILTFKVWHDVFSITAGILTSFAYFVKNKRYYRLISCVLMASWVLNSIFKFYLIALLNDAFGFISVLVAVIRFDLLKKDDDGLEQTKDKKVKDE